MPNIWNRCMQNPPEDIGDEEWTQGRRLMRAIRLTEAKTLKDLKWQIEMLGEGDSEA